MQRRISWYFLISAAILLGFTGATKLISAWSSVAVLHEPDPVIGISTKYVLIAAGTLELAAVAVIFGAKSRSLPSLLVAILGAEFLLYRTVFQIGKYSRGCPCLGRFTAWAHLPDQLINQILWGIAVWLCLGGLLSFFSHSALERLGNAGAEVPNKPAQVLE